MEAETDFLNQPTRLLAKQLRYFLADKTMKTGPKGDVSTSSAAYELCDLSLGNL